MEMLRQDVAGPDDRDAVLALVNSAYRETRSTWTSEGHLISGARLTQKLYSEIIDDDDQRHPQALLVFRRPDGDIVACIHVSFDPESMAAHLGTFAVATTMQGTGIGRHVLSSAESFAIETWGATTADMSVITQRTELVEWYVRRGYHVDTRDVVPFDLPPEYGTPVVENMTFTRLIKTLI